MALLVATKSEETCVSDGANNAVRFGLKLTWNELPKEITLLMSIETKAMLFVIRKGPLTLWRLGSEIDVNALFASIVR